MKKLTLKPAKKCTYDLVSLGEVMLRFDPGENRIRNAQNFKVWEGGGEYNVAKGISTCFGMRSAIVTSLVDNDLGRLIADRIVGARVDDRWIRWRKFDGVGRNARNGLYFMERGFGLRGQVGLFDRAHTAISRLQPGIIDWETIFGEQGVRWFHSGGIFAGLSDSTPEVLQEAIEVAQKYGTVVSYDPNYRASLWTDRGGKQESDSMNKTFFEKVDILFGIDDSDNVGSRIEELTKSTAESYPNLAVIATTEREIISSTQNNWHAVGLNTKGFQKTDILEGIEVLDRVGAGDAFAAGVIYGLLKDYPLERALKCGLAHGALTMTTPGDTSMAQLHEVEALIAGKSAEISR